MIYEASITKKVSVQAHNEASATALANVAVEKGLPVEGVMGIRNTLPKIERSF
jgi:hypothetical protein